MLITVLQKRSGRWLPVREYYWIPVDQWPQLTQEPDSKQYRATCPGCNRRVSIAGTNQGHYCAGGAAFPKLPDRYQRNRTWQPRHGDPVTDSYEQSQLRQYAQNNPNVVVE
jgi:hypothetical protein